MSDQVTPLEQAKATLRARGLVLKDAPGLYSVNYAKGGTADTEYRTDELADALAHGMAMAEAPPAPPPLGPMGKGPVSQRGTMYAHNRKLAARRRREAAKGKGPAAPVKGTD